MSEPDRSDLKADDDRAAVLATRAVWIAALPAARSGWPPVLPPEGGWQPQPFPEFALSTLWATAGGWDSKWIDAAVGVRC
jgi:hypothetical protein